jgi:hypothetical protein
MNQNVKDVCVNIYIMYIQCTVTVSEMYRREPLAIPLALKQNNKHSAKHVQSKEAACRSICSVSY